MTAGRKRRPAATSARAATQEALPFAPPPVREDEQPQREALAALPMAPAPVDKVERQTETLLRPPGHWEVLWVRCEECGGSRHVDAAGRHGAMPVRGVTVADSPAWPCCPHGKPHWENCRGRPVAPPCCVGGAP